MLKQDFIDFKENIANADWRYKLCKIVTISLFITFIAMLYELQSGAKAGFNTVFIVYFSTTAFLQYCKSALFFYIFMTFMLIFLIGSLLINILEPSTYTDEQMERIHSTHWLGYLLISIIISPFLMIYYHYSHFRDIFLEKSTTILIILLSIITYFFRTFVLEN